MTLSTQLVNKNSIDPFDTVIVIHKQQLVVDHACQLGFYRFEQIEDLVLQDCLYLPVQISALKSVYVVELATLPDTYELVSLRAQIHLLSYQQYQLASRAVQLITWSKQHRYCGQCGQLTSADKKELALVCTACELHYYPRISPCMMCLIIKGDECLLAHHHRQPEGMYSTLAGFVEAGESLERTVHREVMEEVGLQVKNLRYFSSQSWPFPHQLMVGYFVDYDSGGIKLEDEEIADAQWFRYDQLPMIPPLTTLSGKLIEAFVHSRKTDVKT
ncbi:MAG: NAD+ diphosphatase [Cellvibrionaceae bacterium]|jgi:NAD+ diphosphatase